MLWGQRSLVVCVCLTVLFLRHPTGAGEKPALPPKQPGLDFHGDPLPEGALARLGSTRFRHRGSVVAVAFSPDSKTLAVSSSGGGERALCLWDVASGKELRRFDIPKYGIDEVCFTPDGKMLLGASCYDVCRWDVATGTPLKPLQAAHPGGIASMALSPAGTRLALGGGKFQGGTRHTVRVLDLATGMLVHELAAHETVIHWLGYSADGKRLASLSSNLLVEEEAGRVRGYPGKIHIWDTESGKSERALENVSWNCALSPDHRVLASWQHWSANGVVALKDVNTGKELGFCEGGVSDALVFSADSKLLTRSGRYGEIRLFDTVSGKLVRSFDNPLRDGTRARVFSSDGKLLVSVGDGVYDDTFIRLWDVATGKELRPPGGHQDVVSCIALSPDGKRAATGSGDRTVRLWETGTGRELHRLGTHLHPITAVAFSAGGDRVASSEEDGTVSLRDAATGKLLLAWPGQGKAVVSLAFAPDGQALFAADVDRRIRRLNLAGGGELNRIALGEGSLAGMSLSPDGRQLALVGSVTEGRSSHFATIQLLTADSVRRLWDHRRPAYPYGEFQPEPSRADQYPVFEAVAFSRDGRLLATSESYAHAFRISRHNPTLRIWEVATGKESLTLKGHKTVVSSLAFSADGTVLVSAHNQRMNREPESILLWDLTTGKQLKTLRGHATWTEAGAISRDGKLLASAGGDNTALIWDATQLLRREPAPAMKLSTAELNKLWTDLTLPEPPKAYEAIHRLATAPGPAVDFLARGLRPVPPIAEERVAQLIKALDDKQYAVRAKAFSELERLGDLAEPALRQAAKSGSLEFHRRVQQLLERLEGVNLSAEQLRILRALTVLERIGTAEARQLLEALGRGAPGARQTREAQAALRRLAERSGR